MKKVFLVQIALACTLCGSPSKPNPKRLYTVEQVAGFLKDLYILEAKVKELRLSDDSTKKVFAIYEQQLLEKHSFDDSLYRKSFLYYLGDVKGMARIYEIIADSLSLTERIEVGRDVNDPEAEMQ